MCCGHLLFPVSVVMVCPFLPWQPLLRKSSFIISKNLMANKCGAPEVPPVFVHLLIVVGLKQRPGHRENKSPGCVVQFF